MQDSYGVPIVDYLYYIPPTELKDIPKNLAPALINPRKTIYFWTRLLSNVTDQKTNVILNSTTDFFVQISDTQLTMTDSILHGEWLNTLVQPVSALIVQWISSPALIMAIMMFSLIIGIMAYGIQKINGNPRMIHLITGPVLTLASLKFFGGPLQYILGKQGLLASISSLGTHINDDSHFMNNYATVMVRHPFQKWNFNTIIDNIGNCADQWSQAVADYSQKELHETVKTCLPNEQWTQIGHVGIGAGLDASWGILQLITVIFQALMYLAGLLFQIGIISLFIVIPFSAISQDFSYKVKTMFKQCFLNIFNVVILQIIFTLTILVSASTSQTEENQSLFTLCASNISIYLVGLILAVFVVWKMFQPYLSYIRQGFYEGKTMDIPTESWADNSDKTGNIKSLFLRRNPSIDNIENTMYENFNTLSPKIHYSPYSSSSTNLWSDSIQPATFNKHDFIDVEWWEYNQISNNTPQKNTVQNNTEIQKYNHNLPTNISAKISEKNITKNSVIIVKENPQLPHKKPMETPLKNPQKNYISPSENNVNEDIISTELKSNNKNTDMW